MLKNKKGFTLVELLAVIVILAVIILIAVTAVIPRMNNAKKKAFFDEALMYLKAGKTAYVTDENTSCYDINDFSRYIKNDKAGYSGTIFLFSDGSAVLNLTDGKYYIVASDESSTDDISESKPNGFIESCNPSTSTYYILYNSNGGLGDRVVQSATSGNSVVINNNTYTKSNRLFAKWNTMPDGSGEDYYQGQTVSSLASSGIVNLYAQWAIEKYEYLPEYEFTGSNNINTNINLFSSENNNRNFEVSFEIVDRSTYTDNDSYMSCMDESGSPYPGMVYRRLNATQDSLVINMNSTINHKRNFSSDSVSKVKIIRKNNIIYYSINDVISTATLDITNLNNTFNVPVTFGSSYKNNAPFRYIVGTLKNMRVYLME